MVTSTISLKDFQETGSNVDEIQGVLDELLTNAPGTDVVLLLAETGQGKVSGKLRGMNGQDVLVIAQSFGGSGHVLAAGFDLTGTTLEKAKAEVVAKVKQIRDKQLGRISETKEVEKTISVPQAPTEVVKQHEPVVIEPPVTEEPAETPVASPEELASLDALVEQESATETEPEYAEIFTPQAVTAANEDEITQAIKSIDDEIENTPNIDVEDARAKNDALQQIGEVIRGYNPGKKIEEKGDQPVDQSVWK